MQFRVLWLQTLAAAVSAAVILQRVPRETPSVTLPAVSPLQIVGSLVIDRDQAGREFRHGTPSFWAELPPVFEVVQSGASSGDPPCEDPQPAPLDWGVGGLLCRDASLDANHDGTHDDGVTPLDSDLNDPDCETYCTRSCMANPLLYWICYPMCKSRHCPDDLFLGPSA